ncbi:MAG TPA: hypothetical protein VI461_13250 [Chitinophagaceae bacterium]|nr:hypothetical protein [Chitinophagaceae bacterium]
MECWGHPAAYLLVTYLLVSLANVLKVKKALLQKELIDDSGGSIYFLDPVYKLWFQKNILHKKIIIE